MADDKLRMEEVVSDTENGVRVLKTLNGKNVYLPADERERMRVVAAQLVNAHLETADRFLSGDPDVKWSSAHVSLFRTLLNKCVPDLPSQQTALENEEKPLRTLTRAELDHILNRTRIVQEVVSQKLPQKHSHHHKD